MPAYKFLREEFRICKIYVSGLGSSVLYPDITYEVWSTVFRIRIRIRLDPHSIWAWIRDPDPYSESGFGFRIQMSKNRFKKPKFTMTDKNRKMLQLSWNFNHSFLSLFQELITLGIFILSHTVKKLSFSSYKILKIIFTKNMTRPGSGIRIRIEILGWIRIRIKRMRIRNTAGPDTIHLVKQLFKYNMFTGGSGSVTNY